MEIDRNEYYSDDIAVVIPTYNRSEELDLTLDSLFKDGTPGLVLVMDQSTDDRTKEVVKKYASQRYVGITQHVRCAMPSTAKATNQGLDIVRELDYKIVIFLDDDVTIHKGFLEGIIKEFDENKTLQGIGAWTFGEERSNAYTLRSRIQKAVLNFFLLPAPTNDEFKIIGPLGNTGSYTIKRRIPDAEWLPGSNMCYKVSALKDYSVPAVNGPNMLQDMDMSYWVFSMHGPGSIIITDKAEVTHRASMVGRDISFRQTQIAMEDRWIFYYRYFDGFKAKLMLCWSLFGLGLLKVCTFKTKGFFKALWYCLRHRKDIKAGIYREFMEKMK